MLLIRTYLLAALFLFSGMASSNCGFMSCVSGPDLASACSMGPNYFCDASSTNPCASKWGVGLIPGVGYVLAAYNCPGVVVQALLLPGQVRDFTTGAVSTPIPECTGNQSPFTAICAYPDITNKQNCLDGSTISSIATCFIDQWNPYKKPDFGQQQTCANGTVAYYPSSCIAKYISGIKDPNSMINLAFALSGGGIPIVNTTLRVGGQLTSNGLPTIYALTPLEAKINKAGLSAYAAIDTQIPNITLGKALVEYIKSLSINNLINTRLLVKNCNFNLIKWL